MLIVWIGYAIAAPSIISNKYRSSGWREVDVYSSYGSAPALPSRDGFKPTTPAAEKQCPRCAEAIKAAAKVCRFCGYEFSPEELAENGPLAARKPPASAVGRLSEDSNADADVSGPLGSGQQVHHPRYGAGFLVRYDVIGRAVVRFGEGERAVALTELE